MITLFTRARTIALILAIMFAGGAQAQPVTASSAAAPQAKPQPGNDWMVVAAGQAGGKNNSYSTMGLVAPLPGSKLGKGWVARVFADELTYRFKGAANREIDALAFGGSATVGFMDSDEKGWWGLYAGPGYRHLDLSPNNPGSKRGNIYSARVQLEGERLLTDDFKLNGLAGADIANNTGYWTRLRAMHRVEGDIFAGPEGMWLGDQNYHAYQVGMAIVGMHLTDKAQIGINGGYRKGEDQGGAGYGGLELGARF